MIPHALAQHSTAPSILHVASIISGTAEPACRTRLPNPPGRVGEPRHVLIYEVAVDGLVDIIAIVPDPVPREVAIARIRRSASRQRRTRP